MKKTLVAIGLSMALVGQVAAQESSEPEQVFNPDIERAGIVVPAIDTEIFELGVFMGSLRLISDSRENDSDFR